MVMPVGHSKRLREPLSLSGRDRRLLSAIAALFVAAVLALGIYALVSPGRSLGAGCIDATFASSTGAGEIRNCGGQARRSCREAFAGDATSSPAVGAVQIACRKAGYTPSSVATAGP
jgi:hypothetical protein